MINRGKLQEKVDELAKSDLANNKVFGSAYMVTENGETVLESYYGYKNPEKSEKVGKDTLYRICSMTKPVTSVALLILHERGLLSIFDPVEKYIPEFKDIHIIDENGKDLGKPERAITFNLLLSHTAGFGTGVCNKAAQMTAKDKESIESTVSFHIKHGIDFEPLSRQSYSAYASCDAAAMVIEKLTGMDYEDFLQKEIFIPLEMLNTTFLPTKEQYDRIISLHNRDENGENKEEFLPEGCVFENIPDTHKCAGAGLLSSLTDYSKFANMLLSGGGDILSEETLRLLYTPYATKEIMPGDTQWGLGVRVITEDGHPYLPRSAYGWSGAYGSHFWVDPINKLTAVFMKNSRVDGGGGNKSATAFEIAVRDSIEK